MHLLEFRRKSFSKTWMTAVGLCMIFACGEIPPNKSLSEEESRYKRMESNDEGRFEMFELPLPELGGKIEAIPLQKHHDIDFPVHWMYFDRPIMLYIDDPPGFNDSLFVY